MSDGFVVLRRRVTAAAAALVLLVWVVPGELALAWARDSRACPMRCASTKDCCCKRSSRTPAGKQTAPSFAPAKTRCRIDCAPATLVAKTVPHATVVESFRAERATASSPMPARFADMVHLRARSGSCGPRAPPLPSFYS